ncbi:MAG: bacteriohemerythrin [Syntrophobacteraceae bacterium]
MSLFVWSEKHSVNVREMDEQHKKLIGMVNQLHDAMRKGKGKEALDRILYDLIQYTRSHFADEERLLRTEGYPQIEEHQKRHYNMTQKVAAIYRDYQDGKANITIEVMTFLENWVDRHIMGTDKQYGLYLNSKGIF